MINEQEESWKKLALEYRKALEDIRDHSGIPEFSSPKWSNYCHHVSFEALKKSKGENHE